MEDQPIVFIDSNYWIYLFDKTTLEHTYIKEHFEKLYDTVKLACNVIVMVEVMHYLVKRLGVPLAKEKWEIFSSIDFVFGNLEFKDLGNVLSELCNYTHTERTFPKSLNSKLPNTKSIEEKISHFDE